MEACFKKLLSIEEVETGYEVKIYTELFINGELSWISETVAFKRVSFKINKKQFKPIEITSDKVWDIPNGSGMKYGLLSHNIDLIHISNPTAKMMGHRSAIMHGMWTVARGISECVPFEYPFEIKVVFRFQFICRRGCFSKNRRWFWSSFNRWFQNASSGDINLNLFYLLYYF